MTIKNTPVVPASMDRPKRVAKQIQEIYRSTPLSRCQAVTARLMFHRDWHALEKAVAAGAVGARHDEDLLPDDLATRMRLQRDLFHEELCPSAANNEELRHTMFLAEAILSETQPTARVAPRLHDQQISSLWDAEFLQQLPDHLADWCELHLPHDAGISFITQTLRSIRLRPSSGTSLAAFGGYWRGISVAYPLETGAAMGDGVVYALAERYARVVCHQHKNMNSSLGTSYMRAREILQGGWLYGVAPTNLDTPEHELQWYHTFIGQYHFMYLDPKSGKHFSIPSSYGERDAAGARAQLEELAQLMQ